MQDTIVIVTDGHSPQGSVEDILTKKLGYPLLKSDSGEHAIRLMRSESSARVSLVILDMFDLSGRSVMHVIREIRISNPMVPILLLTHYGEEVAAAQAIEAGATDFLTKPVTFERLRISIRNALQLQKLAREVARLERQQMRARETPDPALSDVNGCVRTLKDIEQEAIMLALQAEGGCMTRAARNLGIGRSTLYRRLGDLEMEGYISRANQTTRPTMRISSPDRS